MELGRARSSSLVPAGLHLFTIRLPGYEPLRRRVEVPRGRTLELAYILTPAVVQLPSIVVEARRTGIYGVVGDSLLNALPGAEVRVYGAGGGSAATDTDGRFSFPEAPSGVFLLRVTHPAHYEYRATVEVARGEGKEFQLRLRPSTSPRRTADEIALRDLGLRLASGTRRERMTPGDLERYGTTGLCDIPRIREAIAFPRQIHRLYP